MEESLYKLNIEYKGSLIHNLQKRENESGLKTARSYQRAEQVSNLLLSQYQNFIEDITGILQEQEDETFFNNTPYNKEYNYLLPRQAGSKTGIRNLCIRYIACILQVCGVEYTGTLIYKLAEFLIHPEYHNGLIENDIYKIIGGINIADKNQNYLETFDGIFHVISPDFTGKYIGDWDKATRHKYERTISLGESGFEPFFRKWYDEKLTFTKYASFAKKQRLKNNIIAEYSFIFE